MLGPGYKASLSDILAALARSQLHRFDDMQARRRAAVSPLPENLAGVPGLAFVPRDLDEGNADHLLAVALPPRSTGGVFRALDAAGIGASFHFRPLHSYDWFAARGSRPGGHTGRRRDGPSADLTAAAPGLTVAEVDTVCRCSQARSRDPLAAGPLGRRPCRRRRAGGAHRPQSPGSSGWSSEPSTDPRRSCACRGSAGRRRVRDGEVPVDDRAVRRRARRRRGDRRRRPRVTRSAGASAATASTSCRSWRTWSRGEMALLGPRPETPVYVDLDDARWQAVVTARPGIAGPTQVLIHDFEAGLRCTTSSTTRPRWCR